jgi:hypothetical protein
LIAPACKTGLSATSKQSQCLPGVTYPPPFPQMRPRASYEFCALRSRCRGTRMNRGFTPCPPPRFRKPEMAKTKIFKPCDIKPLHRCFRFFRVLKTANKLVKEIHRGGLASAEKMLSRTLWRFPMATKVVTQRAALTPEQLAQAYPCYPARYWRRLLHEGKVPGASKPFG